MMVEFSEESMADLGRALMAAIETHVPGGWSPMDCPSEIVGDLVEELGELRADAARYQKLRDEETWGDDSADGGGSRWEILGELSGAAFDAFVDAMPLTHEPQSAEATAAGLTFCCGKEERLTSEIAALRNVVQRAMIAGCKEAFDAWNYYFPDKPMEPYQRPNVKVSGVPPQD